MSIIYGNVKPTFMEIYPDWKYITKTSPKKTVLKAGTPLGANGRIANNDGAIGLVAENTGVSDNPISIIVGGAVSLTAVQSSFTTLTTACKNALKGILFINSSGKVDVSGEVPVVGSGDKDKYLHSNASTGAMEWVEAPGGGGGGDVFVVRVSPDNDDGYVAERTVTEIGNAAYDGKTILVTYLDDYYCYSGIANVYLDEGVLYSLNAQGSYFLSDPMGPSSVQVADISYAYGSWNVSTWIYGDGGGVEG